MTTGRGSEDPDSKTEPDGDERVPRNSSEGFKEKAWHYYSSRFVLPIVLAVVAAVVAITVAVYVNRSRPEVDRQPAALAPGGAQPIVEMRIGGDWGPDRKTFTTEHPSTYAVLNSIVDNPAYGDERNYVRLKHSDESSSSYTDRLNVNPGDVLTAYVYVANNCSDDQAAYPAATIHGLEAELMASDTGNQVAIEVLLRGRNATEVWDGARVHADESIRLLPIRGTAVMHTPYGDFDLDDVGFGSGKPMALGARGQDGEYGVGRAPSGMQLGAGYLNFQLQVAAVDDTST